MVLRSGDSAMRQSLPARAAVALLAGLSLLCLLEPARSQVSLAIPLQTSCSSLRFFDTSSLQCSDCPLSTFPSADQRACVTCDSSSGAFYDFQSGHAITQSWSGALLQSTTSCACRQAPAGSTTVIAQAEASGVFYQRCVVCPGGTAANSLGQCSPSSGNTSLPLTPSQQLLQALQLLGVGMSVTAATQAFITVPTASGTNTLQLTIQQSQPMVDLLGPSALACRQGLGTDRAACNAVANLCALTLYDSESAACRMYDALVKYFVASGTLAASPPPPTSSSRTTSRRGNVWQPETGAMPWLYYDGNSYVDDLNMDLRVAFSGGDLSSGKVSELTFVLSSFLLNGTWLGFNSWTSQFQLCGAAWDDGSRWTR
ncbi:hypothetical protein TSOC_013109 [Tetrabaena socialis]|uniref:Uncharacterized protein n=1 Tax=Tetrabaena socialis TaxID=47790 RepID=A0A2J7ZL88_9CHLO|nr:hypothetical protein TSOC_013109 [Tetrabaena socialis]|eukprot:PNH01038.1 hypothetical protein TSOC_013109 [Tetrabaena socialis]